MPAPSASLPAPLARVARLTASLVALALVPVAAGAQEGRLVLQGHVVDPAGRTVPGALIAAIGGTQSATAGDDGAFRLAVGPGRHLLRVRRLGYAPRTIEVAGAVGDTLDLAVTLEPVPVQLSEIVVEGAERRYAAKLAGFAHRMRTSAAPPSSFITREQIERRNPGRLSDLLPTADRRCSASTQSYTIWLDGVLLARPASLDMIGVVNAEALEVYRSVSHVPAEYNMTLPRNATPGCIIFVWTR